MWLKKHVAGKHVYWEIVKSYRVQGKGTHHEKLLSLGEIPEVVARALFNTFKAVAEEGRADIFVVSPDEVTTKQPLHHGAFELLLHLWKHLKVDEHIHEHHGTCNQKHECPKMAFLLMCYVMFSARERSQSKNAINEWFDKTTLGKILGIPTEDLYNNRFYRSMDHLMDITKTLPRHIFEKALEEGLASKDYLFYDLTSSYFEGQEAEGAKFGHTRENHPELKQVNWSLSVSREGFPIGFEVHPGNTSDVTTVGPFIRTLEQRYGVKKAVFVGDRGMTSEGNINICLRHGYSYILGYRSDWAREELLEELSGEALVDWNVLPNGLKVSEKVIMHPRGRSRYILCRNEDNVERDLRHRDRRFQKTEEELTKIRNQVRKGRPSHRDEVMMKVGKAFGKPSLKRYFVITAPEGDHISDLSWRRNEDTIARCAELDGSFVIRTNVWDLPAGDVVKVYKNLQTVENAFKTIKSVLVARPFRHRLEDRIEVHIFLYVLAYAFMIYLKRRCEIAGIKRRPEAVLDSLYDVFLEGVNMGPSSGMTVEVVSQLSQEDRKVLQAVGMNSITSSLFL